MSDSEVDETTCLMSTQSTSELCRTDDNTMERDLVSVSRRYFCRLCFVFIVIFMVYNMITFRLIAISV